MLLFFATFPIEMVLIYFLFQNYFYIMNDDIIFMYFIVYLKGVYILHLPKPRITFGLEKCDSFGRFAFL